MLKRKAAQPQLSPRPRRAGAEQAQLRSADDGRIFVDFPGNPGKPLQASRVFVIAPDEAQSANEPTDVTLIVKSARQTKDVEHLFDALLAALADPKRGSGAQKKLKIDADEELTLQCGKSSITLTRSGKVIVRGTKIVSRASGENKIRGAQISLN